MSEKEQATATPTATPAASSTPSTEQKPAGLGTAAASFREKAASLNPAAKTDETKKNVDPAAAVKPDESKADDPNAVKPDESKVDDPNAQDENTEEKEKEGEDKTESFELSPEDQEYVDKMLGNVRLQEKIVNQVRTYSEHLSPATQTWLETQRQARLERLKTQGSIPANQTPATAQTPGEGATGDPVRDELRPLSLQRTMRTVRDMNTDWQPNILKPDDLRQFEIDPSKVPAKYAKALEHFMNIANSAQMNGKYFRDEAKVAYGKRDEVKGKLFEREYSDELSRAGFIVDQGTKALIAEVRKRAFDNGQRVPWARVLRDMSTTYPNIFRKSDDPGKASASTGNDNLGSSQSVEAVVKTQAAPKPPQGTRSTQQNVVPDSNKTKATTLGAAKGNFAERMRKIATK